MEAEDDQRVNVQVVVRCRPLNEQEKKIGCDQVAFCDQDHQAVRIMYGSNKKATKSFAFDRVFGQYSTQEQVFDATVSSIIDEVLQGYNCTVFAYGQTGTGKTFTMEGDLNNLEAAGIIPRSVRAIFSRLDNQRNVDYSIRVSFLELYNEELADLLAPEIPQSLGDSRKSMSSLRLCEDARKGVQVQSLEEVAVLSPADIFKILEKGIEQRRTAETNCNKASSRSHAIFTLKIQLREGEIIRQGQLNLVDLAGSECIGRSLMTNQVQQTLQVRMREAGSINQSLLTLGRVITALVEHHPHVPYRDSKLTRLLQESLGGRAKTCIIATFSPASDCLEETLSTLDYAFRAKNIKNRPECFQRIDRKCVMKEFLTEIDGLKRQLQITREKNGVYIDPAEYEAMLSKIETQELQLKESESVIVQTRQEKEEMGCRLTDVQVKLSESERQNSEKDDVITGLGMEVNQLKHEKEELKTEINKKDEEISCLKHQLDVIIQKNANLKRLIDDYSHQIETWLQTDLKSILTRRITEMNELHYQEIFSHLSSLKEVLTSSISRVDQNLTQVMSSLSITSTQLIDNSLIVLEEGLINDCSKKLIVDCVRQLHDAKSESEAFVNQFNSSVDHVNHSLNASFNQLMDQVMNHIAVDMIDGKVRGMMSSMKSNGDLADDDYLIQLKQESIAASEMRQRLEWSTKQDMDLVNQQIQEGVEDLLANIKEQLTNSFVNRVVKEKAIGRLNESHVNTMQAYSTRIKLNNDAASNHVHGQKSRRHEWTDCMTQQLSDSKQELQEMQHSGLSQFKLLSGGGSRALATAVSDQATCSSASLSSVSCKLVNEVQGKMEQVSQVMRDDMNSLARELKSNESIIQSQVSSSIMGMSKTLSEAINDTHCVHEGFRAKTMTPMQKQLVGQNVDLQVENSRNHIRNCQSNFNERSEEHRRKTIGVDADIVNNRRCTFENSMN